MKLNQSTPEVTPCNDPTLARCFKQRPIMADGETVGYTAAKFNPNVLPKPEDVEPMSSDNLQDFGVYQAVQDSGDGVNMPILPNMNEMQAIDAARSFKESMNSNNN